MISTAQTDGYKPDVRSRTLFSLKIIKCLHFFYITQVAMFKNCVYMARWMCIGLLNFKFRLLSKPEIYTPQNHATNH